MKTNEEAIRLLAEGRRRARTGVRVVNDETGEVESTCTLLEFIVSNGLSERECLDVERSLAANGRAMFGGGAVPRVRVEHVIP